MSYWWSTRGANFVEYQVWKFRITVGRPWHPDAIAQKLRDDGSLTSCMDVNTYTLANTFSLPIGSYGKYYDYYKKI